MIHKDDKPALHDLLESFPTNMDVYMEGKSESISIDVTWYCVGEDFDESEAYYFQFSPKWDEEQYPLKEDIDILKDAPYISVFLYEDEGISTSAVTSNSNEVVIYNFLRDEMGLNAAAACGVLANVQHESSFNPNAVGDSGTSYGICQWHNTRWEAMKNWCASNGYDWTTLIGQLNYLKFELSRNNSAYLWNGRTIYNYLLGVPDTADGAYEAGRYWCYYFEVPANKEAVSVTRGNLAKNTYWAEYGWKDTAPIGYIDEIKETTGGIYIKGWAFDPDTPDETAVVRLYVDDSIHPIDIVADEYCPKVNAEYGSGDYHGFEQVVKLNSTGTRQITTYVMNTNSAGKNTCIGINYATIIPEIKVTDVTVSQVSEAGYTVTCTISDISKVNRVQCPTWTVHNGQDDLDPAWQTSEFSRAAIVDNKVIYRVNASDHNGETGLYFTHIYVYDNEGGYICVPVAASIGTKAVSPINTMTYGENRYELYLLDDAVAEKFDWTSAKTYCESIGGHLATITSQAEQDALQNLVTNATSGYWLGATDEGQEGLWKWLTGEDFNYTNWAENEPTDSIGYQNYLALYADGLKWDDMANNSVLTDYGFICEFSEQTQNPPSYTVSGTITSFGDDTAQVEVLLMDASGEAYAMVEAPGNRMAYEMADIPAGTYILQVSKSGHITRECPMTVEETDVTVDVTLSRAGDISGDGEITTADYVRVLAAAKNPAASTLNEYQALCADINGDGTISIIDYVKILAHVKGTALLW